jgi:predicted dithiol-disulfide oxidoreductase (DUF899 family)
MFGPTYEAGCPTCSSMVDDSAGEASGLQAENGVERPLASSANTEFSFDIGASFTAEQVREQMPPEDQVPAIASQNAAASGTDIPAYISELPAVSVFTREDGTVYQTYATTWRGVEFLMPFYPVLDRVPKGRDEGDAFQTWIRRHDDY